MCEEVVAYKSESIETENFDFLSRNNKGSEKLFIQVLQDFNPFSYIELQDVFDWLDFEHVLGISHDYAEDKKTEKINLSFSFAPKLYEWNKPYSFAFYVTIFEEFWDNETNLGAEYRVYSDDAFGFEIAYTIPPAELPIKELVAQYEYIIKENHEKTLEVLLKLKEEVLYSYFNFPKELKIPCEQYLLYFAQFLQDLGINATSNLTEEAEKVLFSVTPTDDKEALDKIREALAVYLNLPSSPIEYNESFAAMRLKAEIERLQSSQRITEMEFRVTQKALESQDKIILQQSVLLEQQAKVIEKITSKSIMIDSAENKEELVKLYEGLEAGYSKWLYELTGIKANIVKIIDTASRNTLGKGDEIIELRLDKND